MPLMENRVSPYHRRVNSIVQAGSVLGPWVSSGELTADAQVKDDYGLVGGLIVTALDDTGTAHVAVYDSEDDNLVGKDILIELTIPDKHDNVQSGATFGLDSGVEAQEGIRLVVVSGSVRCLVYYK